MSRSTPVCHLKCSKCQAKATFGQRYGNEARTHFNVAVIGGKNGVALCRCRTCGHEYKSRSRAAVRLLAHHDKSKGDK